MNPLCFSFRSILHAAASAGVFALAACSATAQVPVQPETPASHTIRAGSLPPPYATQSANNFPHVVPRPAGAALHVPPGFTIAEWASGLDNPRFLTVAPNGDVFVAESAAGTILLLRPSAGDAEPAVRSEFLTGLSQPFGIAFYPRGPHPKYVYIADTDAVLRFP